MSKPLLYSLGILGIVLLLLLCFYFFYFLRKPDRFPPMQDGVFVSPASGRIVSIMRSRDERYIEIQKKNRKALDAFVGDMGDEVTVVSIMMTPMDVHRQRASHDATLIDQQYVTGQFLNAMADAAALEATLKNEHNAMLFETDSGTRFKIIQIAGYVARRIVSFVRPEQEVKQGEVIGLIKLGSQVTIIFDKSVEVIVAEGQYVTDGETVLGVAL